MVLSVKPAWLILNTPSNAFCLRFSSSILLFHIYFWLDSSSRMSKFPFPPFLPHFSRKSWICFSILLLDVPAVNLWRVRLIPYMHLAYISQVAHADWNWSTALCGGGQRDIFTQWLCKDTAAWLRCSFSLPSVLPAYQQGNRKQELRRPGLLGHLTPYW